MQVVQVRPLFTSAGKGAENPIPRPHIEETSLERISIAALFLGYPLKRPHGKKQVGKGIP
jgi:hypothetical protein